MLIRLQECARQIARAAIAAVDPAECVRRALGEFDLERQAAGAARIFVVGAGKATAPMAAALEELLGDRIDSGWVNVKSGHGVPLSRIHCHECSHPVPDAAGVEGSRRIAAIASQAEEPDLVICLISGGASALMPYPADPVTLNDKQETTRLLLSSGTDIGEINTVRKHLSSIKGGRLARLAAPARMLTLILSDVIGSDPGVIGSGPTAPDSTTFADARRVLERRGIWGEVPASVRELLQRARDESPKPDDPLFERVVNCVIGDNRRALAAAQSEARRLGFQTILLASGISGETREVARVHGAILREVAATGHPLPRPACVLSGGETTVTLRGPGKGGRNQEFALAAALEIAGLENVTILSFGTDGTDGPTDAAGAFASGSTVTRARAAGFDPAQRLEENDSYRLFEQLDDLFITGPTRTNVMDIQILLAG